MKAYLLLLFCLIGVAPAAPTSFTIPVILATIAGVSGVLAGGISLLQRPEGIRSLLCSRVFQLVTLYLIWNLLSGLVAAFAGVSLVDYLKGLAPTLIMVTLVLIFALVPVGTVGTSWLVRGVFVSAIALTARVLFEAISIYLSGVDLSDISRLSQIAHDALSPLVIAGGLTGQYLLQREGIRPGLLLPTLMMLGTALYSGSRAHVLTFLLGWVLMNLEQGISRARGLAGLAILAGGVTGVAMLTGINPFALTADRVGSDESGRLNEYVYAWSQFLDSPIWGQGLGHQVPTDFIYADTTSPFLAIYSLLSPTVGYIHNFFMFLLMDLGLVGLVLYVSMVFVGFVRARRLGQGFGVWCLMVLVVLHVFGMLQPSLRHVPTLMVIALVLGMGIQVDMSDGGVRIA